jgi:flagellar hook assembly protein FlgD
VVNKLLFGFASVALAVASAATSYNVTFYDSVMINGAKVQPGNYKVEVSANTATLKQGKSVIQAPVKVESTTEKFGTNVVRIEGSELQEIRLGGTRTKLVFEKTGVATN